MSATKHFAGGAASENVSASRMDKRPASGKPTAADSTESCGESISAPSRNTRPAPDAPACKTPSTASQSRLISDPTAQGRTAFATVPDDAVTSDDLRMECHSESDGQRVRGGRFTCPRCRNRGFYTDNDAEGFNGRGNNWVRCDCPAGDPELDD